MIPTAVPVAAYRNLNLPGGEADLLLWCRTQEDGVVRLAPWAIDLQSRCIIVLRYLSPVKQTKSQAVVLHTSYREESDLKLLLK